MDLKTFRKVYLKFHYTRFLSIVLHLLILGILSLAIILTFNHSELLNSFGKTLYLAGFYLIYFPIHYYQKANTVFKKYGTLTVLNCTDEGIVLKGEKESILKWDNISKVYQGREAIIIQTIIEQETILIPRRNWRLVTPLINFLSEEKIKTSGMF